MEQVEERDKLVQITLPLDLHAKVAAESDKLGISVTSFMRLLVAQYFDSVQFGRKTPN